MIIIPMQAAADLPDLFVEAWTYSSALSVVEQCKVWAADLQLEPSMLNTISACNGELLELARSQVRLFHAIYQPFNNNLFS